MKNEVKNAIRHLVTKAYQVFATNKTEVSVISLPGSVWEFENSVINHKDFADNFGKPYDLDMTLVECDTKEYQSNLAPLSTLFPHNKVSSYVLSRKNVTYDNLYANEGTVKKAKSNNIFAWFDFCGNPTTQNLNLVNTAIDKNVTYIFTFNTHWRCNTNVNETVLKFSEYSNKPFAIHTYLKALADALKLSVVWSFEYISNQNPMITVCLSNDANILADSSLMYNNINLNKKINLVKSNKITKVNTVKRDLTAVYTDVKSGIDKQTILNKHNINAGTLYAVKAWVTMGK